MENDFILVLDLGGPEAVQMARKLRNQHYYTEIISRNANIDLFRRKAPRGILIAGADQRPAPFPRAVLSLGIPVLALGGAARTLLAAEGAKSEGVLLRDRASQLTFMPCPLFDGLTDSDRYFTRIDGFTPPPGFQPVASTPDGIVPAFADLQRRLYALQFYAETNDPDGAAMLSNFAEKICGCTPVWTMDNYLDEELRYIRERVQDRHAVIAVSGGVDSSTCALLMRRAIGNRLRCVLIDHGMMRAGEVGRVQKTFQDDLGLDLTVVDARQRFLERLAGIADPADKRRAVHDVFVEVLAEASQSMSRDPFLIRGTIYSDLLATGASDEAFARYFDPGTLLEPMRMLFKDEVRELGEALGLPVALVNRQPFPSPGLAVRCQGEVTPEKLALLRQADAIFRETVEESGQGRRLSRYFTVLTDSRVCVASGERAWACALRAVVEQESGFVSARLPYDLLDRASERILSEVNGIGRVAYDISGAACGAIEWE